MTVTTAKVPEVSSKKWFQSKTIIAGIISVIIVAYNAIQPELAGEPLNIALPVIPQFVYALLGALGVYGRMTSTTVVK